MSRALPLLTIVMALAVAAPADAARFLVNTSDDTPDAVLDGRCADARGRCSLRAAITEANQAPDFDTINFRSFMRIMLTDFLPAITSPVWINGHSARGAPQMTGNAPAAPVITLDGDRIPSIDVDVEPLSGPDAKGHGLHLFQGASGSLVQGLSIVNFQANELLAEGINDSVFTGLWVGVDIFGRAVDRPFQPEARDNWQTKAEFGGSNNQIGEFSFFGRPQGRGNMFHGTVEVIGSDNRFARNRVGADRRGRQRLGSRSELVVLGDRNAIGGRQAPLSSRRNVLSNIYLEGDDNSIVGNFVGRGRILHRLVPLTSLSPCVLIATDILRSEAGRRNSVGDGTAFGRNYIGGDCGSGMTLTFQEDATVNDNDFRGHRSVALSLQAGSQDTVINNTMRDIGGGVEAVLVTGLRVTNNRLEGGGSLSRPGIDVMDGVDSKIAMNTVGKFATGISVDTSGDSEVRENFIGTTTPSGAIDWGNRLYGVFLESGPGDTRVTANVIAHSGKDGIKVEDQTEATLSKNSFINNCELGIDLLGVDGRDANDPGDLADWLADDDPQNTPVILNAVYKLDAPPSVIVEYYVDNDLPAEYPMTIEVYLADERKVNQGARMLAAFEYDPATPGAVVTKTIPLASDVEGGALVAIATNFAGLTSEFSPPVLFGQTGIVIDDSIDECQLD